MLEPLFIPGSSVWAGSAPWAGGWLPPSQANGPAGTAPMLLAAAAMNRGHLQAPGTDHEVEDLIYDTLELFPGAADVEVRCEAGRVTLAGSVSHKRLKHDVGEIAWAIPSINDVVNNITIASRRRARSFSREGEPQPVAAARKGA
jgi:hypothetical protein